MTTTLSPGEIQKLTPQELIKLFPAEASLHRNIVFTRGTGVTGGWNDFKIFLRDLGPKPSDEHNLVLLNRFERTYGPDKARWMTDDERVAHEIEFDRIAREKAEQQRKLMAQAAALKNAKAGVPPFGQWTTMGGRHVSYVDVANKLAIPIGGLSKTLKDGRTPDDLIQRAASADQYKDFKADWMPDDGKTGAFMQAFRIWHMQVLPPYSRAATPTFLFLFIAVPMMKESYDKLSAEGLWNPLSQRDINARDNHIAWKKYTELMPRAQTALMEIPIYASYSLMSELDQLCERIVTAEHRFRYGPKGPASKAA